jgi:hypothetical protein
VKHPIITHEILFHSQGAAKLILALSSTQATNPVPEHVNIASFNVRIIIPTTNVLTCDLFIFSTLFLAFSLLQ